MLHISIVLSLFLVAPQENNLPTKDEKDQFIETHNQWRSKVGVEPILWSDELARSAAKWARKLQKDNCGFYHSDDSYGENIWKGTAGYYTVEDVVNSWASEIEDYDYDSNKCKPGKMCGHYTQIVWSTTERVGCAKVECDGYTTWVCQYDPPGNWVGKRPY